MEVYVSDCGSDHSIANAHIDFGGLTIFGHTVPVTCNDGYKLQGDRYIKCLADGTWSKTVSCHIKSRYKQLHTF